MGAKYSIIKSNLLSFIFVILIILMGIEIILLAKDNRKLRRELSLNKLPIKTLKPNEKAPSLMGTGLDGKELLIEYPFSKKTVLFWFSPECSSCEENIEFWKELYKKYGSEKSRFFGVTIARKNDVTDYVSKYKLEFPVLMVTDSRLLDYYQVHAIPQTMIIETNGEVQKVWPGVVLQKHKEEIQEMIGSIPKS